MALATYRPPSIALQPQLKLQRGLQNVSSAAVQVGDAVWVAVPGSQDLVQDIVVATQAVQAEGLYNAFTNEGLRAPQHRDLLAKCESLRLKTCAPARELCWSVASVRVC